MRWAWTHNLLHGCPTTYPLHHIEQLKPGVEETNYPEDTIKCNKEALFSIAVDDVV